jgi:hypothetical protein
MPVLAVVMKLLYIRRKHFYIEHLVFLLHYHSAVFVFLIIYFVLLQWLPGWLAATLPAACILFLAAAMKVYYRQGWIKTIMKWLALLLSYTFLLVFFILMTVVVSLIIYR